MQDLDQFYLTMVYQLQKQFSINWTENTIIPFVSRMMVEIPTMAYTKFQCQHLPHGAQDYEQKTSYKTKMFQQRSEVPL